MPTCDQCEKEIPLRKDSDTVFDGFFDTDNKMFCCRNKECRKKHYEAKSKTKFKNLYSELPIVKVNDIKETLPNSNNYES